MAYKWDTPQEWLLDKVQEKAMANDLPWLLNAMAVLIAGLGGDHIQDIFQGEMDADQYFDQS